MERKNHSKGSAVTQHLLLVSLGPVQDFIAQARRTRDLWFGSHLLVEVSRAAAGELAKHGAKLIVPALDEVQEELSPCDGPLRPSGKPPMAIPNKVLAVVPPGLDPRALATDARAAAQKRWADFAANVKEKCQRGLIATSAEESWQEQVDSFLEFLAAWLPFEENDYATTRASLEREMAARKLLRDFDPWTHQRGHVPKSSLDGARETVLVEPQTRNPDLVRKYRISPGEQLDAVGLVKRAGGEPEQFIPLANVALAGWIDVARKHVPKFIEHIDGYCKKRGLSRIVRPDLACGRIFAYDAEVFFEERWYPLLCETRDEPRTAADRMRLVDAAREFGSHIEPVLRVMNEPYPYVACIVADGDHMSKTLEHLDAVAHKRFSQWLAQFFGARVRTIVEQDHRGILVYTGGDDVLAFVSVKDAVDCAQAIRDAFDALVKDALAGSSDAPVPTLSVGIGMGHLLESMGELRRLGRSAEKLAKTQRNALGIIVDKRSGGTTKLLYGWPDDPKSALDAAVKLLLACLSMKKVHEIQRELSRMPKRNTLLPGEQTSWSAVLRGEVERILARTNDGEGLAPQEAGLSWKDTQEYDTRYGHVEQWVRRMLIAKEIIEAARAATPKENH